MSNILFAIFRLSLTGSTLFLICHILAFLLKRFLSTIWQYAMRVCSVIFFLVPFNPLIWLITKCKNLINGLPTIKESPSDTIPLSLQTIEISYPYQKIRQAISFLKVANYLIIIWFVGVALFLLWQAICFDKLQKSIKRCRLLTDAKTCSLISDCLIELNVKQPVKFLQSEEFNVPFYTGIIRHKVILPKNFNIDNHVNKLVVQHELYHMLHKDVYIKTVCLFIRAIHWFNPLIYLLCNKMDIWCENFCDECVTKDLSYDQKKEYALAILSNISGNESYLSFNSPFNNSKINFKRRVDYMLNIKKSKKSISFIAAIAILCCGFTTAYAQEIVISDIETSLMIRSEKSNDLEFAEEIQVQEESILYQEELILSEEDFSVNVLSESSIQSRVGLTNFIWTVAGNAHCKSDGFTALKGDQVNLAVGWEGTAEIQIGIMSGSTYYYYTVTDGLFSGSITVPSTGIYYVVLKNVGSTSAKFTGFYYSN